MPDAIVSALAICGFVFALGLALGLADRNNFSIGWLLVAVGLILLNDAMLTRAWGAIPWVLPASDWNWQGKIMALGASLLIASLAAFRWKRSGLTLNRTTGSLLPAMLALGFYLGFFLVIGLTFGGDDADTETIAFQLTMPGVEEEIFYRGILLLPILAHNGGNAIPLLV